MKEIDINSWKRKEHFEFFKNFDEPFFGIVANVDCTEAYLRCKEDGASFYKYYLHCCLCVVNSIPEFKTRIVGEGVVQYESIGVSPTVLRDDKTFGFSYVAFSEDFSSFSKEAELAFDHVRLSQGLDTNVGGLDVIHCSAVPWISFTSVSHARNYKYKDSCPKVSFGKIYDEGGRKIMPVSLHAHHGLADGYHAGLFFEGFQNLLNKK